MVLGDVASGRTNNFDFLRLVAATLVIFSHCFPLTGRPVEPLWGITGWDTFGALAVFSFFTMSGFLIAQSWLADPRLPVFLGKRCLRILPGLCVSVLLTATVLGPLATTLPVGKYFHQKATWHFLGNGLFPIFGALPGVFTHNPLPHAVNGSFWTLPGEMIMYALAAGLGMLGLLRRRAVPLVLLVGLWAYRWHVVSPTGGVPGVPVFFGGAGYLNCYHYFLAGMVLYLYRDRVVLSWRLCGLLLLVAAAASHTPRVYLVMDVALPYAVLCCAYARIPGLSRAGRFGDLSFGIYIYAFPVQQLFVQCWGGHIHWLPLFLLTSAVVFPLAFLSWHCVEAPALRLKRLLGGRSGLPGSGKAAPTDLAPQRIAA